ncbi:hypothetical protein BD410DRAFT_827801 [Rickenella mellea]|uniref:Uncharacterized protein n=1 Tax=Rickenella mellea TaxID=50990 RepID=A0A4Y7Q8I6_9AGAM|nr:hypothetical protein BD410DRAFT_827801 [Rickenella mellea]
MLALKPPAVHIEFLIFFVTVGATIKSVSSTAGRKTFDVQDPGVEAKITVPQATSSLKHRPQEDDAAMLATLVQRTQVMGVVLSASCAQEKYAYPELTIVLMTCIAVTKMKPGNYNPVAVFAQRNDVATSTFTSPTFSATIPTLPTTTYSIIPAPEATDGSFNTTISAVDPRIQYSNLEWGDTYTCNTTSKTCSEPAEYMLFQFVGTAIFMNLNMGLTGMIYSASVDGSSDIVDGFRSANSCGTGWSRFGLSNELHTVNITILGTSPQTPNSLLSEAAVDFSSFIVTSRPNGTSGGNPSRVSINSGISTSPTTKSNAEFWTSQLILAITCIASTTMVII